MNADLERVWRRAALPLGLLVWLGGFAALYAPVVAKLARDWSADPNYSHGFLVLPLAAVMAWDRRTALRSACRAPSWWGLIVIAASLVLLLAGTAGAELFLARVSIVVLAAGTVLFAFGWRVLRAATFPIAFLLFMIPPPAIVFNQIALPLQLLASTVGETLLRLVGVAVFREGNVLVLPNVTLQVSEACSGIRSLVSLGTAAAVFAYMTERRRGPRMLLAFSAIPIAVLLNALRVAATGIAAAYYGAQAADGVLHTVSGWLMFVVAVAMLWAVQRILRRLARNPSRTRYAGAAA